MLTGHESLDNYLQLKLQEDIFWRDYLTQYNKQSAGITTHLAVFVEPYLQFILEGRKTVESRFSINRCAPYRSVNTGDIILLKRSGGPIVGLCLISDVWFFDLDIDSWKLIKDKFAKAICAQEPEFWTSRANACYATLMRIEKVRAFEPINYPKRDRRGWVVLSKTLQANQLLLPLEDIGTLAVTDN